MAFIPEDAKWYLAEVVLEFTIEDDPRNVVHRNLLLVRADSPEEAYRKGMDLGADNEASWENIDGKRVTIRFRGLCYLNVIHDELEHGAELSYREDIAVEESKIQKWVASKEELGVFRPISDVRSKSQMQGQAQPASRHGRRGIPVGTATTALLENPQELH